MEDTGDYIYENESTFKHLNQLLFSYYNLFFQMELLLQHINLIPSDLHLYLLLQRVSRITRRREKLTRVRN